MVKKCLLAVIISSVFVCFYGVIQFLYLDPFNWAEPFSYTRRIFSTIGQPNFLGHYLIMVIPVTVFWLVFVSKKIIARTLLSVLLVSQMSCLYFTWSRSALLGLFVQGWVFLIFFFWLKCRRIFKVFLIISTILALLFAALFLVPKNGNNDFWMKSRWISSFNLNIGSAKTRMLYWSGATKQFLNASPGRKVFGFGQDVLSSFTVRWYDSEWANFEKLNLWPDRMHNLFFDALMSTGVFSVLVYFAIFILFAFYVFRYIRNRNNSNEYFFVLTLVVSFAGYLMNNFLSFSLTVLFIYFYLFLALLASLVIPWKEREFKVLLTPFSKIIIVVAFFFFITVFIFYKGVMMLKADSYFMDTRNKERISNCAALPSSRLAMVTNPDEGVYREEYIYNALNCLEVIVDNENKKALMDNIDLVLADIPPKEVNYFLKVEIANSLSVKGRYFDKSYNEKAENAFLGLIKEYPNVSQVYFYYGFHKLRLGDYEGVLSLVSKVDSILPQLKLPIYSLNIEHWQTIADERVRFYDLAASASEKKGDLMGAADYYLKAVKASPYRLVDYKRRADMYYLSGQIDDAITCNQRGYSMSRKDYSWPLAISLLYDENKNGEMAVEYANQALAINEAATSALKILEKYGKSKR